MTTSPKDTPILKVVDSGKKPNPKKPTGTGGGSGSSKAIRFGDYSIHKGMIHHVKAVRDGTVDIPLCNFVCKIICEILLEDGLTDTRMLRIEGRRADGALLPRVDVPAKDFYSTQSNWVNDAWGTPPLIYPGTQKKDHLRTAIHSYSQLNGDIEKITVYRYTGWKKLNDKWHYLSGAGALTASGLIDNIDVDLGAGHIARYQLPAPLTGDELKQAVTEVFVLLDVCQKKAHIGFILLAAIARAPLGECHPIDFVIWLHGLTGSRKSELAALALAFFGDFNARRFASNWLDSETDIEHKLHQIKDGICVIDDFKPSSSIIEANKLHAKSERILRGTGNQGARGTRLPTFQARPAPYNRSMTISTAEDTPRGQSLIGRALLVELAESDVDIKVLSRLQRAAASGLFRGVMSTYICWLAPKLDDLKTTIPKMVEQMRDAANDNGSFGSSHSRASTIYSNLIIGLDTFFNFLEDAEAISTVQTNAMMGDAELSLQQVFRDQSSYQREQDEVERFLQILRAVFSSGNAHIDCRLNQGPPPSRPYGWGWRDSGIDALGDKILKPMGDSVGWFCDEIGNDPAEVWFQQDAVFKVVQTYARAQGDAILLSPTTLWRRMFEKGFITKTEQDKDRTFPRLTVKRIVSGRSVRVMILPAALIESGD